MGFLKDVGEFQDFGGGRSQVMDSLYIVKLNISGEPDVTDNGAPFVPLTGTIQGGPFDGVEVESRFSLSVGKPEKLGAVIGFHKGTAKVLSGQDYNEQAWVDAGFQLDEASLEGLQGKELGKAIKAQMCEFYYTLDEGARLALMLAAMNVARWDGKTVIAHISLEESNKINPSTGAPYLNNGWAGFYALNDVKKGRGYVEKVAYPAQQRELEAQQQQQ